MVLRAALGVLLGLVARLWLATLRVRLEVHPELDALAARRPEVPWVLAFLHGKQWPLLAWRRRRPTAVMVSLSADGAMQARALSMLGLRVVRGSSSRGGARGLAALVRALRSGTDAAFAVDGPRGPYGVPKPGAALAAARSRGVLVPMGSAIRRGTVFDGAWDRFGLAWPFSTVAVVLGAPVAVAPSGDPFVGAGELESAIGAANARAEAILSARARAVVPLRGLSSGSDDFRPSG